MRLDQTPDNIAYAAWLLDVGAGKNLGPGETVQLPETMICDDNSVTGLISSTYSHIDHHQDDQYYLDRTILSGKNSDVEDINSEVLQRCPGEEKILQSADSVISDDGNPNGLGLYPMEYLNSLRASSLPLAKLALKIGNLEWFTNHLMSIAGPCSIDILNGLQIISNIYQWTL
ncbi:ATP-dependent DNA helicase PIF1 [Termitomyces sp. T112]|nr:ATP-dependent DNA helicase PIF1 [Termitomyces sp. T112]